MNGHYNVGEAARLSNVSAKMVRLSMAEMGELLNLWQNRRRPSASVKRIASDHVTALDAKMAKMAAMRKTLQHLIHCCSGDERPDCPILDELAQEPGGHRSS